MRRPCRSAQQPRKGRAVCASTSEPQGSSSSLWTKARRVLGKVVDWADNALDGNKPREVPNAWEGNAPDTTQQAPAGLEQATFAAGCFWGPEQTFAGITGVVSTETGYTQGKVAQPTYGKVCSGRTGHAEAVRVVFEPREVSYEQLLSSYFDMIDPTDKHGQGSDRGPQYRTGIYWHTEAQRDAAVTAVARLEESTGRKVWTEVKPAAPWWRAEETHQKYFAKGGLDPKPETPYWINNFVDND